jgi:hypothetical protein
MRAPSTVWLFATVLESLRLLNLMTLKLRENFLKFLEEKRNIQNKQNIPVYFLI